MAVNDTLRFHRDVHQIVVGAERPTGMLCIDIGVRHQTQYTGELSLPTRQT